MTEHIGCLMQRHGRTVWNADRTVRKAEPGGTTMVSFPKFGLEFSTLTLPILASLYPNWRHTGAVQHQLAGMTLL